MLDAQFPGWPGSLVEPDPATYRLNGGAQIIDAGGQYKIAAAGSAAAAYPWAQQNTAAADFMIQEYGQITVLNPQSYPVVGGDWTIEFRTHGIHDLAVSAIEGTTFGDYAPDDVGFVDLWCGSDSMRDATARNGVITFEDYRCHGTSSLVLRVHTPGMHDLQFSFGAGMAYASNNAYPRSAVAINAGTAGGLGLSGNDFFGTSVAAIGDLDGDGVQDLAAGATGDDGNGGSNLGAVHVMFMNDDGTVKGTAKISNGTSNGPALSDHDSFGRSVAAIGDLDGDGVQDIAAGANGDDNGGPGRGAVHVMFMNDDGTVKGTAKISNGTSNGPALSDHDSFGRSVAAIGDLDGDGVQDIAAGAWGDDTGGPGRGAVHVMFMNDDGTVKGTAEINDGTAGGLGLSDNDGFGRSVAAIGDLDGDGVPDLAAGAWGDDTGGPGRGAVHVMFMNGNGTVKGTA